MMGERTIAVITAVLTMLLLGPQAQAAGLQKNEPIQISSDKLDVLQADHKAIFTGNVIATQGTTNMRSKEMTVFYREDSGAAKAEPAAADAPPSAPNAQGIYRIEAVGDVVFTTPTETAIGEKGIYNVETDTIDLIGGNVTLTRGQNILKGTKLNYNMATGRSVLTGGNGAVTSSGKPARVHGLFVPKSDKAAEKK